MNDAQFIEDRIDRYVYQVVKYIPSKNRNDIRSELRSLIFDMLEERTNGLAPSKKDLEIVLTELGTPMELAAKYQENTRGLIGPGLYPQYSLVVKIVLACVAGGITISSVVLGFIEPETLWFLQIFRWLSGLFFSCMTAFGAITLIFAIFERRGIKIEELTGENTLANLPPVPKEKARISRAESICGLIFTGIVTILFLFFPQLMAAYLPGGSIPIFNLEALRSFPMVLLCLCFLMGLIRNSFELMEGAYTFRLLLVTLVTNAVTLVLSVLIFTRFSIFNPQFPSQLRASGAFTDFPLDSLWNNLGNLFALVIVFAILLDTGVTLYHYFRHGRKA